jgi:hypothetical protein
MGMDILYKLSLSLSLSLASAGLVELIDWLHPSFLVMTDGLPMPMRSGWNASVTLMFDALEMECLCGS